MDSNYISGPSDFRHMEGNSVDFRKTFNLNGTDNDENLRLYLRKAGLSDEIEYLTAEQRRAFIYDIINSNKMPGYWMPSTMKNSSFSVTPPTVRPPPPPPTRSAASSPFTTRRNDGNSTPSVQYGSMTSSSSSGSLKSLSVVNPNCSPIVPHRFVPAPDKPPSPSTFITNAKGSRYEISGPVNFQHVAGDMTRDMTRNAFDLTKNSNDNVLKKYMIERGITEEDISGMRKPDMIRNIVQSKYNWMPPKRKTTEPKLVYATISTNNEITPPPSPQPSITSTYLTTPTKTSAPSNFSLISSRFADPSLFPSPDDLFGNRGTVPESPTRINLPPLPPLALRPAPPPRKSKNAPPPPPSAITVAAPTNLSKATSYSSENIYEKLPSAPTSNVSLYATVKQKGRSSHAAAPPPPPPVVVKSLNNRPAPPLAIQATTYRPAPQLVIQATTNRPAPPLGIQPTAPVNTNKNNDNAPAPPPPPPPPPALNPASSNAPPAPPMAYSTNNKAAAPLTVKSNHNNGNAPPPPPPPPPPPGPVLSAAINNAGVPPPPPPMLGMPQNHVTHQQAPAKAPRAAAGENNRDAFLDSIRQGVNLKKVNQKAATISGIKPRPERKPATMDFLSELKMGLTLRRGKNPEDNQFAGDEPDESHA